MVGEIGIMPSNEIYTDSIKSKAKENISCVDSTILDGSDCPVLTDHNSITESSQLLQALQVPRHDLIRIAADTYSHTM